MSKIREGLRAYCSSGLDELIEQVRRYGLRSGDVSFLIKVASGPLREGAKSPGPEVKGSSTSRDEAGSKGERVDE